MTEQQNDRKIEKSKIRKTERLRQKDRKLEKSKIETEREREIQEACEIARQKKQKSEREKVRERQRERQRRREKYRKREIFRKTVRLQDIYPIMIGGTRKPKTV